MLDRSIIEQLYIKPLNQILNQDLKFIQEPDKYENEVFCHEYITVNPKIDIVFYDENNVDVYWNDECFMFDRNRNFFTSSDTYDNIVYEVLTHLETPEKTAAIVIKFLEIIYDSEWVGKEEIDTGKRISTGYNKMYNYIIHIKKKNITHQKWQLGNIVIIAE